MAAVPIVIPGLQRTTTELFQAAWAFLRNSFLTALVKGGPRTFPASTVREWENRSYEIHLLYNSDPL